MAVYSHTQFIDEVFARTGVWLQVDILVVNGHYLDFAHATLIIETEAGLTLCYHDRPQQVVPKAALVTWFDAIRQSYARKFLPILCD